MGTSLDSVGRKGIAVGIGLAAAFLVFKVVLGIISTLAWVVAAGLVVFAFVWVSRVL